MAQHYFTPADLARDVPRSFWTMDKVQAWQAARAKARSAELLRVEAERQKGVEAAPQPGFMSRRVVK